MFIGRFSFGLSILRFFLELLVIKKGKKKYTASSCFYNSKNFKK